MARVIILLMDSFGIGAAQDADKFGDNNPNTFAHIAQRCEQGEANLPGQRAGPLQLPNLQRLGLYAAGQLSCGDTIPGYDPTIELQASYGYAVEQSFGKDTPSGHWEIAGVPVLFDWGYFPPEYPSFPQTLIEQLCKRAQLPGILGNKHASGTTIIEELGAEHIASGKPIAYTSADSVFQIAAHEEHFGLQRLYEVCTIARELVDEYNIGRVIARPFVGEVGDFTRTGNRRDLATPPPESTLLDYLVEAGHEVISVGKIADIFAQQGITQKIKADGNNQLFSATLDVIERAKQGSLIFTNFVDFDSAYGHRRDVAGYAHALEAFDQRLPELESRLHSDDIVIITADHGCDPTHAGTDHTREHIPVLMFGPNVETKNIGRRETFADIGQTIAEYLGIAPLKHGTSFLTS